jgi:hypothetical protein
LRKCVDRARADPIEGTHGQSRLALDFTDGTSVELVKRGLSQLVRKFDADINAALTGEEAEPGEHVLPLRPRSRFVIERTDRSVILKYNQDRFFKPDLITRFEVTGEALIATTIQGENSHPMQWDRRSIVDVTTYFIGSDRSGRRYFDLRVHLVDGSAIIFLKREPEEDLDQVVSTLRGALVLPPRLETARRALNQPSRASADVDNRELNYEFDSSAGAG